jgi:hypothetical protein
MLYVFSKKYTIIIITIPLVVSLNIFLLLLYVTNISYRCGPLWAIIREKTKKKKEGMYKTLFFIIIRKSKLVNM